MDTDALKQGFMDAFRFTGARAVLHLTVIVFGLYLVYTGDANAMRLFLGYAIVALLTVVRELIAFRQRRQHRNAAANV